MRGIKTGFTALTGGMDLVTPAIQIRPGHVISGVNYEPVRRGYRRMDGFERLDGRPKPSQASYWILRFESADTPVLEGDQVTGDESGATAVALVDAVVEQGSYGGGDASGYLVLMGLVGEFVVEEDLMVSGSPVAISSGVASNRGALNDNDDNQWLQLSIEKTRAAIEKLPGSGPVRGVHTYQGRHYAFRDNEDGDEGQMFVATTSGWSKIDTGTQIRFSGGGIRELEFSEGGSLRLEFTSGGTYEIEPGDTITGATSSAEATVEAVVIEEGQWSAGDAAGFLVLSVGQTGTFQGENLNVGSNNNVATIAADSELVYPQVGDRIRGDNLGPYAEVFQIDVTSGGWAGGDAAGTMTLIDQDPMAFEAGRILLDGAAFATVEGDSSILEIEEGDTITGAESGATATVVRVILQKGSWSTSNAEGRFVIDDQAGTFEEERILVDGVELASVPDNSFSVTLPPGGRYDIKDNNFFGAANLIRMYGVNGVGNGFEWDGETFVTIETGMKDDRPIRVETHQNHLMYAYQGGSLQHSGIGNPYNWEILSGASEIGIGENITDLISSVSGAMAILGVNKTSVLMGNDAENWVVRTLADDAGGFSWSAQLIGSPIYMDNRGLRSLNTTDQFGDFNIGTVSQMVEPFFQSKRNNNIFPVASIRVRRKDQYRVYFSDGTGMTIYFRDGSGPEALPFELPIRITCTHSGKDLDGNEILLAGSDDGMVYQLDAGTSFDGERIEAFLRMPFNHVGSPTQRKRWLKATVEMDGGPNTTLGLTAEFSYADPDQPPAQEQQFSVRGSGGFWNEMTWDEFFWSSPVEGLAEAPIDGIGRNVSITVVSSSIYEEPHTIHGLILHYSNRGIVR